MCGRVNPPTPHAVNGPWAPEGVVVRCHGSNYWRMGGYPVTASPFGENPKMMSVWLSRQSVTPSARSTLVFT